MRISMTHLDGLERVFDLEKTAFGREGVNTAIVIRLGQKHDCEMARRATPSLPFKHRGKRKSALCVIRRSVQMTTAITVKSTGYFLVQTGISVCMFE